MHGWDWLIAVRREEIIVFGIFIIELNCPLPLKVNGIGEDKASIFIDKILGDNGRNLTMSIFVTPVVNSVYGLFGGLYPTCPHRALAVVSS